jgi:hypothetical protein
MTVDFKASSRSTYFSIFQADATSAFFNGPLRGSRFKKRLLTAGTYTIQVYLTRNAARRSETANYIFALGITGLDASTIPSSPNHQIAPQRSWYPERARS